DDNNQTGQMLAALTGWAQGTFASAVNVEGDHVSVTREVDGGLETVKLKLPAIVTTDLRLNEPRYASLPNIMKAKSKPLDTKSPADYGVDTAPRVKVVKVSEPPVRSAGVEAADVAERVAKPTPVAVQSCTRAVGSNMTDAPTRMPPWPRSLPRLNSAKSTCLSPAKASMASPRPRRKSPAWARSTSPTMRPSRTICLKMSRRSLPN